MADTDYNGVLLEDINGKFDAILDSVKGIREQVNELPTRNEFDELKDDVKTIKAVVTQTNKDLDKLDSRVTVLEKVAT
ncbi:MAG: hypothetical protein Q7R60_00695 [bacterium]|nr:hypothetical protein [bacterium]